MSLLKRIVTVTCLVSLVGMAAWKLTEPRRREQARRESLLATSDARVFKENIHIQGDEWVGYLVFKSKAFQDALAAHDIGVVYDLEPDFKTRVANLENGVTQVAAMTVDAWVLNGRQSNYPGVIGFVIDESTGGDVIVGGPKINSINDLDKPGIRGTFVGYSPSEFLLKSSVSHFNLKSVRSRLSGWRTDAIADSVGAFRSGKADFAVLWEPQASEVLATVPGAHRILDTSQVSDIIIDVGIFSRKFVQERPQTAGLVSKAYFQALHQLLNRPDDLRNLAMAYAKADKAAADAMLAGLEFTSLDANRQLWFGSTSTGSGKLFESIQRISQILVSVGDMQDDPLAGNPYTITNRRLVGDLANDPAIPALNVAGRQKSYVFRAWTPAEWSAKTQQVIGTLIDEPILFTRGTSDIAEDSEPLLAEAAAKLAQYPSFRVQIEASVAPGNDLKDDEALSSQRAEAIRAWLIQKSGEPEARFNAQGLGSSKVPPRLSDESFKAWENRCRYARIYLVKP